MKNNFTFGIIGAMECEVNSLKSKLQNLEELVVGKRIFYVGELNSHKVILVQSGVGKVNSAICVQYIIDKFNPDFIINTGIAGGLGENMQVGDIVIGTEFVQYDFDVTAIGYALGYMCTGIDKDKPTKFYSDAKLINEFEKALQHTAPNIKYHKGVIASGDCFVSSLDKKLQIKNMFNALAVEMEGAAIAQTANLNKVPCVIVRAISDLADDNAAKDHEFVEEDMAEHCSSTIENLLKHIS